ncbi:hypothetical protein [Williamsia deligens]|uniref:Uncharacterized protein n=1 Tax=Williamsia deligens TaxID=321325 RepID=A0ABW3GBZ8_9NOCA|nr:hypothetical protein [Williamsia deligens]
MARLDDEARSIEECVVLEGAGWTVQQWAGAVEEALILLRALCA